MSAIFDLADAYVSDLCTLEPFLAAVLGTLGSADHLGDYSPDGVLARSELTQRVLAQLRTTAPESAADELCRTLMLERLGAEAAADEAGESWRMLRNFGSPVQTIRQTFDFCPKATEADWADLAVRLRCVPDAIAKLQAGLRYGLEHGQASARRQALVCAQQAATWGGIEDPESSYFLNLCAGCPFEGDLGAEVHASGADASAAYASLASFLRDEYAPGAPVEDAVGRDRYRLATRQFLGTDIDLEQTYAWGWEELHRLETEMGRVAKLISPDATLTAAIDILRNDPARALEGSQSLQAFLQDRTDRAVADLSGKHFEIPAAIRRCECMLAPTGTAAAMYYTPPSEDLSRPGRTWYPTMGRTRFPLWFEVSTAYHEGVPGHHLQFGMLRCLSDQLSRFQRTVGWVSGNSEGWALYAERLMGELGFLEKPDYEMGMLFGQAFRAMRVVVDIGLHLDLRIPHGEQDAGERWDWDLALRFADRYSPHPGAFTKSEVERYLGIPAQAISYKVGEREWLDIRNECQRREGSAFDLKGFHDRALQLGPIGLDQLRTELTR